MQKEARDALKIHSKTPLSFSTDSQDILFAPAGHI